MPLGFPDRPQGGERHSGPRQTLPRQPTQSKLSRWAWEYEEILLQNVQITTSLLVRVMIGKVEDLERLVAIFRIVPVIQNNPDWRCRTWCANALAAVAADGKAVGTSVLDWEHVEEAARWYAGQKTAEGRFSDSSLSLKPRPTWDLLQNKELIP